MPEFIDNLAQNVVFIFERITWLSIIDMLLVAIVFFIILLFMRGTQAVVLLRGLILFIALVGLLASLEVLPAFSWLVRITLPALVVVIPVIFAPEIRQALERLGRAGYILPTDKALNKAQDTINAIVYASSRLSSRKYGALIVMQRRDSLEEYIQTGVYMNAAVTAEMLLQIFFPNTPLHDGAAIISGEHIIAAACVLPLSSSGVLSESPERQMGLRHRAGLGITEVSDAIAIVVSEETGSITVVHNGRMIRRLDPERLENVLRAFFKSQPKKNLWQTVSRFLNGTEPGDHQET